MKRKTQRLWIILTCMMGFALAVALILSSVIAIGYLNPQGIFIATEVLAKHDETYMPKEIADALRKNGKWDPRFGPPPDPDSWNHMIKPQ